MSRSESMYKTALFEHQFWLQVLGDHARFIHSSLAPSESGLINHAEQFIHYFDQLLDDARKDDYPEHELDSLTQQAYNGAEQIRSFKLLLIEKHLTGEIKIQLGPTFINHMINEVEEYLRILPYLLRNEEPPKCHPVHHHLIWLLDASGHAEAITESLDQTERMLKEKSREFTQNFNDFYLKAVEMAGYLRTHLDEFPALDRMNHNVKVEMVIFQEFLNELEEMAIDDTLLSTFSPLMADHMMREECYYLTKLAETTNQSSVKCDPTKPRSSN